MKKAFFLSLFISIFSFAAFSLEPVVYIASPDGLSVRTMPSLTGKKIGSLKYMDQIKVHEEDNQTDEIDGIKNKWIKVSNGKITGWVWGAYLTGIEFEAQYWPQYQGTWTGVENEVIDCKNSIIPPASSEKLTLEFVGFDSEREPCFKISWKSLTKTSTVRDFNYLAGGERGGFESFTRLIFDDRKLLLSYSEHRANYDDEKDTFVFVNSFEYKVIMQKQ